MSVIIRLQNLPWSANSYDIRQFFQGLSIPEGGVHIVGGELGDAFIAFSTDEDARQAMMMSGGKLKEIQVQLLLSSRNEMQKVIEAARSMVFPAAAPAVVQPPPAPEPPVIVPTSNQQVKKSERETDESRSRRRSRSRSRSRDRKGSRRDSRDDGRRRRSRSRDRRRKNKSRSRSRDRSSRDRYGRDLEKRDEAKGLASKDKDKDSRNNDTRRQPAAAEIAKPPLLPLPNNAMGLNSNLGPTAQLPFGDDPISVAMRKTLSAMNLPFNLTQPDPRDNAGNDPRRAQRGEVNDTRNGREKSPVRPVHLPDVSALLGNPALNIAGLSEILRQNAFGANLNANAGPSQVWLTPQPMMNPLANLASNPAAMANIAAALPNLPLGIGAINNSLLSSLRRPDDSNRAPVAAANRMIQDSDSRGGDSGGSFGMRDSMRADDRGRFGRFPEQDRFEHPNSFGHGSGFDDPRGDRNNRPTEPRFERPRPNFERNGDPSGRPRRDVSPQRVPDRRREENFDRRNDFGPRDPRSRDLNRDKGEQSENLCIELINLASVSYNAIRKPFNRRECKVDEIRYKFTPGGRRAGIRMADIESKDIAMEMRKIRIGDEMVEIAHLPDDEFFTFEEDPLRLRYPPEKLGEAPDHKGRRYKFEGNRKNPREHDLNEDPRSRRDIIPENKGIDSCDCVIMTNLPPGTTDRDLCDFFSDIGLTPKKMHVMMDFHGESLGEAFVEFWTVDQAKLSTTKNGAPIGRNNVNVRLVMREEVEKALRGERRRDDLAPTDKPLMPLLPEVLPGGPGRPPMPLFPGGIMPPGPAMRPRFGGMGFNPPHSGPPFRGPRPRFPPRMDAPGGPPPPADPDCTVTMYNIPYRAGTDEILEFFGSTFDLTPMNVFRKLNDRGQPTSVARVIMKSPEMAMEAVKVLENRMIRERPIQLGILGKDEGINHFEEEEQ